MKPIIESSLSKSLALLTRTEVEWLLGKAQLSKQHEYRIKSNIRKKLQTFEKFELPLIIAKSGLLPTAKTYYGLIANSQQLITGSQTVDYLVAKTVQSEGRVNREVKEEENSSPRRDSDPRPKVYENL